MIAFITDKTATSIAPTAMSATTIKVNADVVTHVTGVVTWATHKVAALGTLNTAELAAVVDSLVKMAGENTSWGDKTPAPGYIIPAPGHIESNTPTNRPQAMLKATNRQNGPRPC